jgi:hypothetical protein
MRHTVSGSPTSSLQSPSHTLLARRAAIAVVLAVAAPGGVRAQGRVLQPGDVALRADRIRTEADTLVVLFTPRDGAERVSQTITRTVRRIHEDGGDLLRLVEQHATPGGASSYDTVDVVAGTLALRRLVASSRDTAGRNLVEADLRVVNGRLQGITSAGNGMDRTVDLDESRVFTDLTAEAFVAALPLSDSSHVRALVLRVFDLRTRYIDFVAEGSERLQTAAGMVECVRVRAGGGPLLWLARDDGRLIRSRWEFPDGTVAWKLPKRDVGYQRSILVEMRPGVAPRALPGSGGSYR